MQIVCQRKPLLESFSAAAVVCPGRTPMDILKNVLFEFDGETASISATDAEIGICCPVRDVKATGRGSILLSEDRVLPMLKEMSADEVTFDLQPSTIEITSGFSHFSIGVIDVATFPKDLIGEFSEKSFRTVSSPMLKQALKQSLFAVDSLTKTAAGIYLEFSPKIMRVAATDSRRLSVIELAEETVGEPDCQFDPQTTVQQKAMIHLEKILPESGTVEIAIRRDSVAFRCEKFTLIGKRVTGYFPKWQQVIPGKFEHTLTLVVAPLMSAIRQASIVSVEDSVGVEFEFSSHQLTLRGKGVGRSMIQIPVSYEGEKTRILLVPKFIVDFLRSIPSASFQLQFNDSESAALMTSDDFRYIIMPLTLVD